MTLTLTEVVERLTTEGSSHHFTRTELVDQMRTATFVFEVGAEHLTVEALQSWARSLGFTLAFNLEPSGERP